MLRLKINAQAKNPMLIPKKTTKAKKAKKRAKDYAFAHYYLLLKDECQRILQNRVWVHTAMVF